MAPVAFADVSDAGEPVAGVSTPPPGHETEPHLEPAAKPAALDTDDTRGWHFKRLLRSRLTIYGGGLLVAGAGIGAGVTAGAAIGGAAAAGAILLLAVIVFAMAHSAAVTDFFRLYAEQRGLTHHEGRGRLPAVTPLLRKGDRRYCEHAMTGALPGGVEGTLARYTYEVDTTDSDGDRQTAYYHFNVVVAQIPESSPRIRELFVQRRSGARFLDGLEDSLRRKTERLELESEALDKRYEIFHHTDDDLVYMHELFTPTFIVWLTEQAPEDFAFEYSSGTLCVNTKGHYEDGVELDRLCEAAAQVHRRLLSEATE